MRFAKEDVLKTRRKGLTVGSLGALTALIHVCLTNLLAFSMRLLGLAGYWNSRKLSWGLSSNLGSSPRVIQYPKLAP